MIYLCVCVCVYIYMCACVYIYMCVNIVVVYLLCPKLLGTHRLSPASFSVEEIAQAIILEWVAIFLSRAAF